MYPREELNRLAVRKAALGLEITLCRADCGHAAARALRPLETLDRIMAFWRRLSPLARFAAVPLGFVLKRTLFRRAKVVGSLLSWGPLVARTIRGIASAVSSRR